MYSLVFIVYLLSETHAREKGALMDEIVALKKDKALLERENSNKTLQNNQAGADIAKNQGEIRSLEQKVAMLLDQVYLQKCILRF